MQTDPCEAIRTRVKQVRESWTAVPLREGTQQADWREQAIADIELMEAAAEVITQLARERDEARLAMCEARSHVMSWMGWTTEALAKANGWGYLLEPKEEHVSNSYKSEATNGL